MQSFTAVSFWKYAKIKNKTKNKSILFGTS